jgi:hypothetical protein
LLNGSKIKYKAANKYRTQIIREEYYRLNVKNHLISNTHADKIIIDEISLADAYMYDDSFQHCLTAHEADNGVFLQHFQTYSDDREEGHNCIFSKLAIHIIHKCINHTTYSSHVINMH